MHRYVCDPCHATELYASSPALWMSGAVKMITGSLQSCNGADARAQALLLNKRALCDALLDGARQRLAAGSVRKSVALQRVRHPFPVGRALVQWPRHRIAGAERRLDPQRRLGVLLGFRYVARVGERGGKPAMSRLKPGLRGFEVTALEREALHVELVDIETARACRTCQRRPRLRGRNAVVSLWLVSMA